MKNIYIGDIHGRDIWKQIVKEHEDADNIIFIGDYFDSFNVPPLTQLRNIEEILDFKKWGELDPSKKVYLLVGNHDIHYFPNNSPWSETSGFQPSMKPAFENIFRENRDAFHMSITIGNCLCTHAGVSSQFLKDTGYWTYDKHIDESYVSEFLNDLFFHKQNEFEFDAYSNRHYGLAYSDPYGENEGQSPIWIRPKSLMRSNKTEDIKKKYIQIVGHTPQNQIDIKGTSTGGRYFFIDALQNGEYLIEIDNKFYLGKIEKDKNS